ncbi:hypothetical protein [Chelativorans sp. M5D2P16]|uniref:hypothetical protein n=1 Tax=Chelativorans sp. M5D2P16 TaxID=3095678 RepID=UPI002ACA61C4|nr:hypothetical protein [Chelativorans sp. M5D2P16]MDZ5696338.1 hypothetical protein [Chelativorans sp. M5D2P16]
MPGSIFYLDKSEIREGKLQEVKAAIADLVAFLDSNVPRAVSYGIYLDEGGTQMTVVQIHPDSASLEHHMKVGAPEFAKFKDLVKLQTIEVYGEPSRELLGRLTEKARMLGGDAIAVNGLEAGFERFRLAS